MFLLFHACVGTESNGALVSKSDGSIISRGFFNETLDLSQEDIQRTLSANMPMCANELENHHPAHPSEPNNTTQQIKKQTEPANLPGKFSSFREPTGIVGKLYIVEAGARFCKLFLGYFASNIFVFVKYSIISRRLFISKTTKCVFNRNSNL